MSTLPLHAAKCRGDEPFTSTILVDASFVNNSLTMSLQQKEKKIIIRQEKPQYKLEEYRRVRGHRATILPRVWGYDTTNSFGEGCAFFWYIFDDECNRVLHTLVLFISCHAVNYCTFITLLSLANKTVTPLLYI